MAPDSRTLAWAVLAHKHLPQRAVFELLQAFADPRAVLEAPRTQLARVVAGPIVDRIVAPCDDKAMKSMTDWLGVDGNRLLAWGDPDYPRALLEVSEMPPVLFHVGRADILNRPALAIVGSRNATPQGNDTATEFASALASAGLTIVSGLALGIDAAAHRGALTHDASTIAVVGTGLDRVYPARHRELAHAIAEKGALLSEFLPGTPPRRENFPRRNRLLSALAKGVLVVEATLSSGSLITARLAGEQGREVFAIPGSIHSPFSKGCHKLIREGAKLVEKAEDVLVELGMATVTPSAAKGKRKASRPLEGDAARVLDALGNDVIDLETLVTRTQLPAATVVACLTTLEIESRVGAMPGGLWQRRD
ncbi:MAG TPA: DNA-processing protein DprA [Casimicrobiaceae bacterium]|nr:DNA-processing protein DprA [Casimicrobiaceae bacterium]